MHLHATVLQTLKAESSSGAFTGLVDALPNLMAHKRDKRCASGSYAFLRRPRAAIPDLLRPLRWPHRHPDENLKSTEFAHFADTSGRFRAEGPSTVPRRARSA